MTNAHQAHTATRTEATRAHESGQPQAHATRRPAAAESGLSAMKYLIAALCAACLCTAPVQASSTAKAEYDATMKVAKADHKRAVGHCKELAKPERKVCIAREDAAFAQVEKEAKAKRDAKGAAT